MAIVTLAIFVVLCLATVGVWQIVGYLRYRKYFNSVDGRMADTFFGRIWVLPPDELSRLDDLVRRCYLKKAPIEEAVTAVVHEINRDPGSFRSHL